MAVGGREGAAREALRVGGEHHPRAVGRRRDRSDEGVEEPPLLRAVARVVEPDLAVGLHQSRLLPDRLQSIQGN